MDERERGKDETSCLRGTVLIRCTALPSVYHALMCSYYKHEWCVAMQKGESVIYVRHEPCEGYHFRYCIEHTVREAECVLQLSSFRPRSKRLFRRRRRRALVFFSFEIASGSLQTNPRLDRSSRSRLSLPENDRVTNMHLFPSLPFRQSSHVVRLFFHSLLCHSRQP